MPKRYLGNIITDTPTAPTEQFQDSSAVGIWSIHEALTYKGASLGPHKVFKPKLPSFWVGKI